MLLATRAGAVLVDKADDLGWTPLHFAASEGHKAVVAVLLAAR
jgi:ankyrin repeat protein